MSKFINHAAYLPKAQAYPFSVKEAPYISPKPNEIAIKIHAIALNPVDHIMQTQGTSLGFSWLTYPLILGSDVAGIIVEAGISVSDFKVGDRVIGQCLGTDKSRVANHNAEAAYQEYCILQTVVTSKIPDTLSFENACALPLAMSTAACGMFQKDYLGLDFPQPRKVNSKDQTLLVWGGSTSVGINAIQLAVAAGYDVITTCSPKNFGLCESLGATRCFDYRSPTVEADIAAALNGKVVCGALAIGTNSALACINILSKHDTKSHSSTSKAPRKFVSIMSGPEFPDPKESLAFLRTISRLLSFAIPVVYGAWRHSIGWKFVFGTTLAMNEVGPAIYRDFLPEALSNGQYRALPEAMVVGEGLDKLQEALDTLKKGISAKKVVVKLA